MISVKDILKIFLILAIIILGGTIITSIIDCEKSTVDQVLKDAGIKYHVNENDLILEIDTNPNMWDDVIMLDTRVLGAIVLIAEETRCNHIVFLTPYNYSLGTQKELRGWYE